MKIRMKNKTAKTSMAILTKRQILQIKPRRVTKTNKQTSKQRKTITTTITKRQLLGKNIGIHNCYNTLSNVSSFQRNLWYAKKQKSVMQSEGEKPLIKIDSVWAQILDLQRIQSSYYKYVWKAKENCLNS